MCNYLMKKQSVEHVFGCALRGLMREGMHMDQASFRTMSQVLGVDDAIAMGQRLANCPDAEAWSMRDLALFPDRAFCLAVETLFLEQEAHSESPLVLETDALVDVLEGVRIQLVLPNKTSMLLDPVEEEVRRIVIRLHVHKPVPEPVRLVLAGYQECPGMLDLVPEVRMACRRARLKWTHAQEAFVLDLLRFQYRAEPAGLPRERFLALFQWCLGFLEYAGEDIAASLAGRRDDLRRRLDQALEAEKVREKCNYETRRMLGGVEPCLDATVLREELHLVGLAAQATGGYPPGRQVFEQDLGNADNVRRVINYLDM